MENKTNYYEAKLDKCMANGLSLSDAAFDVINAYIDGKPARRKKKGSKPYDRDGSFWSCFFLDKLPHDVYQSELFILALTRYFDQENTSNLPLINHIATAAPESVYRAVRYSGLVLRIDLEKNSDSNTDKWQELKQLAIMQPENFGELVKICSVFHHARHYRLSCVQDYQQQLADLSTLDLLSYISLFAYQYLMPGPLHINDEEVTQEIAWATFNNILSWKLKSSAPASFQITELDIIDSLKAHLIPFIMPSPGDGGAEADARYQIFGQLFAAQIELDSFMSRSVEVFCYDDTARFELSGLVLNIVDIDVEARQAWDENSKKLMKIHSYWLNRGIEVFAFCDLATVTIGTPENHDMNQVAYIRAMSTKLQLIEVYGLSDKVVTDNGLNVDLFQALLSLELMTAFYQKDFLIPYERHLKEQGNWQTALCHLAMEGLIQDMQNRFPFTWSKTKLKAEKIQAWTVNKDFPSGNQKAAEAILDFWCVDLANTSRLLQQSSASQPPALHERPILKFGNCVVQLPWITAYQNNATAAINNLRRIGNRRSEVKTETARMELQLSKAFEAMGFKVCLNFNPEKTPDEDPGEVDLICSRDGVVLVLEIKSTFIRSSHKDAWYHKTRTLRKAGEQVKRKVAAVNAVLLSDPNFASVLGLEEVNQDRQIHGWIVDSSIECDHEYFSGFLKVSIHEVLIALRDDAHLLVDPNTEPTYSDNSKLYPNGFSAGEFVKNIEQQAVWTANDIEQ